MDNFETASAERIKEEWDLYLAAISNPNREQMLSGVKRWRDFVPDHLVTGEVAISARSSVSVTGVVVKP